jgi:ABC-type nitrate/sulfonate/bicarbonate transport system permease component
MAQQSPGSPRAHIVLPVRRPGDSALETLATLLAVLMFWQLAATVARDPLRLPGPIDVLSSLRVIGAPMALHGVQTWSRVILGLLIGIAVGPPIGRALRTRRLFAVVGVPLLEMLRPIPPVALAPFLILWFQGSYAAQVGLIAYATAMTLAVGSYAAVGNVNPEYIRAALSLGADKRRIIREVISPAIQPELVGSIRIAAALAFAVAVVAELLGAQSGLGYLIMVSRRVLGTPTIILAVIVIGLESWVTDAVIRRLSTRRLRWVKEASTAVELASGGGER